MDHIGAQLFFREKGEGEPLLMLHGNGGDSGYFTYQLDCFSSKYRAIALDTRGYGGSPRGTAPYRIRQFAEDLLDFMNAHAMDKAHILGFSDGGNIALCFALAHPERVDRLILNGANLKGGGVKTLVQLSTIEEYWRRRLFGGKSEENKRKLERLDLMVHDPNIPEEDLRSLSVKTLVIAGNRDMIKAKHTRRIAEALPNAQLCILPGDHFIAAKTPDTFNEAVMCFLESD